MIFLFAVIYGTVTLFVSNISVDGLVLTLITPMSILAVIKIACIIFSFILAAFFVFLNKKTVVGCLNNKYKLVDGDECYKPIEEEVVEVQTKKISKSNKAVVKKEKVAKKSETKKKTAKKTVKKETTVKK